MPGALSSTLLGVMLWAAGPEAVGPLGPSPGAGVPPAPPAWTLGSPPSRSAPLKGAGPRLAARVRHARPGDRIAFLVRGLDPDGVRRLGGRVTARLGPILAVEAAAEAVPGIARAAVYAEGPQPLRPALDVSRAQVGADRTDFGDGFEGPHRGAGVLVAAYDTGVDLAHPDLRALDGPPRVRALWDQERPGLPPPGQAVGHLCDAERIAQDLCEHTDAIGHGTSVLAVAASSGPLYRGIAPEAELVVAASTRFERFVETLDWFRSVAEAAERPMVVNLSLTGHEGPHDGTSLEAQAVDALDHLTVIAAGNEGTLPVHALARLDKGERRQVALRFPFLPEPQLRRAVVDVWGDVGLPLAVQVSLQNAEGAVRAETATVSPGDPGLSTPLLVEGATVGFAMIDAEPEPNPFNGQGHVRVAVEMIDWSDEPDGLGLVTIGLRGEGRVDLWVDSPSTEPSPIRFDRDRALGADTQVLGDTEHTVADIATAATAVAVSAYVGRDAFTDADGVTRTLDVEVGAVAEFSSYGPTLSPSTTGDKPDLAAPGLLVIAARSADAAPDVDGDVSDLYRAGGGTSFAAPHVSGAAAVVLGADPSLGKADLAAILTETARTDDGADAALDARWGHGKLDVAAAVARVAPTAGGCRGADGAAPGGLLLGLLWAARRRRRPS